MEKSIIKIKLRPVYKREKGAPTPLTGAGTHKDRRTKRKRTRQTQKKADIEEQI
jgi:hypothetical protein